MSNAKISALTSATLPLDGTEVLPIVQSSTTKKVANNDLRPKQIQSNATSGVMQIVGPAAASTRVMTIPDANFTAARTDAGQTFTGTQTFSTAIATGSGGTGLSSFTSGGVLYASSTSALATISTFTYNGTTVKIASASSSLDIGLTGDSTYHYARTIDNAGQSFYFGHDNSAGSFFGAGAYGRVLYSEGANPLKVYVNGAYRATYDTSGNYKLETGNLVVGTSGKGIDFSAVVHSGSTSKLLADYEEGTWTPAYGPTSGAFGAVTYELQVGTYTKIGSQVTIHGYLRTGSFAVGTATGNVLITGIPFTPKTNKGYSGSIGYSASFASSTVVPVNVVDPAGSTINLYYRTTSAGNSVAFPVSGILTGTNAASNYLYLSITYEV